MSALLCSLGIEQHEPVSVGDRAPFTPRGRRLCWPAHDRTTACRQGEGSRSRVHATLAAPFTPAVLQRPLSVIASKTTPHTGSKEHPMITETQTRVIVLQLTDEMLTQLQPFMAGLD